MKERLEAEGMATRLHNPGQYEIVYDAAGHMLGGGESVEVDEVDAVTAALIERGLLIVTDAAPGLIRKKREPKTPPPAVETRAADKKEDR